jgi:hypothetical protein
VEFTQAGEPTVTFREQGGDTQQAEDQSEQQNQQQDTASAEEPASDEAVALQSAEIDTTEGADQQEPQMAGSDEQQPPETDMAETDQQPAEADMAEADQQPSEGAEMAQSAEGELVTEGEATDQTAEADQTANRPAIQREGYAMAEADQIVAEELDGHTVYGMNDEDIGDISELVLSSDGQVENVIIDVGGFLGLGEKPVMVDFDQLAVMREEGGDDIRVYIDSTQDELEQMERYSQ